MFPPDIQQKITYYIDEISQAYEDDSAECALNKREQNIYWFNMPNIQKIIRMDELSGLRIRLQENLSGDIDAFQSDLQAICAEYVSDQYSPLYRYGTDGGNPAFELLLKVVAVVYETNTVEDLLSIFIPNQLVYTFNDTLLLDKYSKINKFGRISIRESNIQIEITQSSFRDSPLSLRAYCPDDLVLRELYDNTKTRLIHSVWVSGYFLDLNQIKSFSFALYCNLYRVLRDHYPAVEEKLYLRNSAWELLREKIQQVEYQKNNALHSKLTWLQGHLRALGSRNTGEEIMGGQIEFILEDFKQYLQGFKPEIRDAIYNTSVKPRSLFEIIARVGECGETAADAIDYLLHAPNYQGFLSMAPKVSESEEVLISQYSKQYCHSIETGSVSKIDAPDHHIQKALQKITVYSANDFIVLLGNFPPEKFEIVLSTIGLRFIPNVTLYPARLPEIVEAFQNVFCSEFLDPRSKGKLAWVMAKYPEQFGGVEFLARLAIMLQHMYLLDALNPNVLVLPLHVREKLLEYTISGYDTPFLIMLRNPKLFASVMKSFTTQEFAAWLCKSPQGMECPRIFDLLEHPAALLVILEQMDLPLKKLLMIETMYEWKSFLVRSLSQDSQILESIFSTFPEHERLGIVTQSRLIRIHALDRPLLLKRILYLLPESDREVAVDFGEPYVRSLKAELCYQARHETAVECMKIILQALPKARVYRFLTKIDDLSKQSALHLVSRNPSS